MNASESLIAEAYIQHRKALINYVYRRINDYDEATDMVQDVFVRLLSYDLLTADTIKSLCYTIASNLVVDYLRRHCRQQAMLAYATVMEQRREAPTPEQITSYHNLEEQERIFLKVLTPATSQIYYMTHIEGMDTDDIAKILHISKRTVECHQFKGRRKMREMFRAII